MLGSTAVLLYGFVSCCVWCRAGVGFGLTCGLRCLIGLCVCSAEIIVLFQWGWYVVIFCTVARYALLQAVGSGPFGLGLKRHWRGIVFLSTLVLLVIGRLSMHSTSL